MLSLFVVARSSQLLFLFFPTPAQKPTPEKKNMSPRGVIRCKAVCNEEAQERQKNCIIAGYVDLFIYKKETSTIAWCNEADPQRHLQPAVASEEDRRRIREVVCCHG